jgi:hypothetical protein
MSGSPAEEELVHYAVQLKQRLDASERMVKELQEKNVQTSAHVVRMTKEKRFIEETLMNQKDSYEAQLQGLLGVLETQQSTIDKLHGVKDVRSMWKSLLPLHDHGHIRNDPSDVEDMAQLLTLLSSMYAQEIPLRAKNDGDSVQQGKTYYNMSVSFKCLRVYYHPSHI